MYFSDLGLNSATIADKKSWDISATPNPSFIDDTGYLRPIVRQPLPTWITQGRTRKAGQPFQAWVGIDGTWGRGRYKWNYKSVRSNIGGYNNDGDPYYCPVNWTYGGRDSINDQGNSTYDGGIDKEALWVGSSGCLHLVLAAGCRFELVLDPNGRVQSATLVTGPLWDYDVRPYYWDEAEVQEAYRVVSDGEVDAGTLSRLLHAGQQTGWERDEHGDYILDENGQKIMGSVGTDEDIREAAEIHRKWDVEVAQYLAFSKHGLKRPFVWPEGDVCYYEESEEEGEADELVLRMASMEHRDGDRYRLLEGIAYRGRNGEASVGKLLYKQDTWTHTQNYHRINGIYENEPEKHGFHGWRESTDGALTADDWKQVGRTILGDWTKGKFDKLASPIPGIAGRYKGEAFDLRIYKSVTHPKKFYQQASGSWDPENSSAIYASHHPGFQKNGVTGVDIECYLVSGSRPADRENGSETHRFAVGGDESIALYKYGKYENGHFVPGIFKI